MILIINLIINLIPIIYTVKSSRNNTFYFFSPLFFPFLIFNITYLIPSSMSYLMGLSGTIEFPEQLYIIGILFYMVGVVATRSVKCKSLDNLTTIKTLAKSTLYIIMFTNVILLFFYGVWSGVTTNLLQGNNIEDLRRTAEIGKGFLKEPAVNMLTISSLMLTCCYMDIDRKSLMPKMIFIILLIVITVLFITTGHKKNGLLPVLIFIAAYNKIKYLKVRKVIYTFSFILISIGFMNTVRGGVGGSVKSNFTETFIKQSIVVLFVYKANYAPIVQMVKDGNLKLQLGKEYYEQFLFVVPRFIYKDKPISFDYYLKELTNQDFEGGGSPPTVVGSLYLNYGLYGVIFGMTLIGSIYQILFNLYGRANLTSSVLISLTMYYVLNPSQAINSLLMLFICFTFVMVMGRAGEKSILLSRHNKGIGND